jgi:hypothetical protein
MNNQCLIKQRAVFSDFLDIDAVFGPVKHYHIYELIKDERLSKPS